MIKNGFSIALSAFAEKDRSKAGEKFIFLAELRRNLTQFC